MTPGYDVDEETRAILAEATRTAASRGAPAPSAEDLLVALLAPGTRAARVARARNPRAGEVGEALRPLLAALPSKSERDDVTTAMSLAEHEAARRGASTVDSTDLLLGQIQTPATLASVVLGGLGLTVESTRATVARLRAAEREGRSGEGPASAVPLERLSPEEALELPAFDLEEAGRFERVESSPLERVIPVGTSVERDGITVEMLALEVRAAGAIAHWRALPSGPLLVGAPSVRAEDSSRTAYGVRNARSWGSRSSCGGQVLIVPAPPSEASAMRLTFADFLARPSNVVPGDRSAIAAARQTVPGPWKFDISLSPASRS